MDAAKVRTPPTGIRPDHTVSSSCPRSQTARALGRNQEQIAGNHLCCAVGRKMICA